MEYEEFIENYTPELQLIEALDLLQKGKAVEAVPLLEKLGVGTKVGKNSAEMPHSDPTL